jgi:hypothetical protein
MVKTEKLVRESVGVVFAIEVDQSNEHFAILKILVYEGGANSEEAV